MEAFVEAQTSFVKSCSPPSISFPGRRYSRYSNRGSCQAAAASGGLRRLSLHRERLLRCAGPEIAAVLLLLRAGVQDGGCGWMGVSTACFPLAHGRTVQNAAGHSSQPRRAWLWHSWLLAGISTLPSVKRRFSGCGGAQAPSVASYMYPKYGIWCCPPGEGPPSVVKPRHSCEVTSGPVPAATRSALSPAELRLPTCSSLWHHLLSQVLQEPACPAGPKHHHIPHVLRAMHS